MTTIKYLDLLPSGWREQIMKEAREIIDVEIATLQQEKVELSDKSQPIDQPDVDLELQEPDDQLIKEALK